MYTANEDDVREDFLPSTSCSKGQDSSVGMATGWTVRGSNSRGGEIFRTHPDCSGAHPASYTMGTGSFQGVKQLGRGIDHPPPSSAEVKERAEPYLHL